MNSSEHPLTQLLLCEYRIVHLEHVTKQVWRKKQTRQKASSPQLQTKLMRYKWITSTCQFLIIAWNVQMIYWGCLNTSISERGKYTLSEQTATSGNLPRVWRVSLETEQLLPLEFAWNSYRSFTLLSKSQHCKYYSKIKTKQHKTKLNDLKTDKTRKANMHNPEIDI